MVQIITSGALMLGLSFMYNSMAAIFIANLWMGTVPIGSWQTLCILIDRVWPLRPAWSHSEQVIILYGCTLVSC